MNVLPLGPVPEARREAIASNCVKSIELLIEAVHLAVTAGPDEEAVLIQCIRRLYAQAEEARRAEYFAHLLEGLNSCRPKH
jgi:hypothetical protein